LDPGSSTTGSRGHAADGEFKPHPKPRAGAAIPGLALQNTREYAKQLDEMLLIEADGRSEHQPDEGRKKQQEQGRQSGRSRSRGNSPEQEQRLHTSEPQRHREEDKKHSRNRSRDRRRKQKQVQVKGSAQQVSMPCQQLSIDLLKPNSLC